MLLTTLALAFDHTYTAYQSVLSSVVSSTGVRYSAIRATPQNLNQFLAELATTPLTSFTAAQKKAFYLNTYNALTLDMIADNYPIRSIMDLDGGKVWDTRTFRVAGTDLSLNAIENTILRPLKDPRIHAALNCSARSCPPLQARAFLPETLDAQLDSATRAWAATTVVSGKTVTVSKLFEWYAADFAGYGAAYYDIPGVSGAAECALNFISAYAPDKAAILKAGNLVVVFQDYDWTLAGS